MKFLLNLALIAIAVSAFSQTPAFEKNAQLGSGINLGNMFEAPSETAWGNPFRDEYIERIAALGFDHIRVPIRWETAERSQATAPYTIKPEFLDRIRHVVDLALEHKLHVIINMHHHEALFEDPDGQRERFLAMWKQIAQHFSGYPDSLLFELLNEPNGNLTAEKWNTLLADGIRTIRETDPNRFLVIGIAEWGGLGGLSKLILPDDGLLILTIHYYNPFSFTHQGADWVSSSDTWLGTRWNDTESERMAVQSEFSAAIQYRSAHNVPIHIGEFGAFSKADLASRSRWTTYLARYFESQQFSWGYWEFSAGFGIYDPATQTYTQELVDALLHNPMPEPAAVNRTEIMKTGFETDGDREGWMLNNSSGALSTGNVSGGLFTINIANGGTQGWHVQLAYPNLLFEEGKDYEIQLRAKASASRPVSVYAGMNADPWSAYSGYSGYTFESEMALYTLSFQMKNPTDAQARLVLDLGNSTSTVIIDEISIYEVSLATASPELKTTASNFYPNPTNDIIYFSTTEKNSPVYVYSLTGQLLLQKKTTGNHQLDLSALPAGQYILTWQNGQSICSGKLLKL